MKGDFTRSTFDRTKHYGSVRMQQGRVQLDADWNEQMDIAADRIETEALDVIGRTGAPKNHDGFHIVAAVAALSAPEKARPENQSAAPLAAAGDFYISGGRYYVEGVLCRNEQIVPFSQQPDLPDSKPLSQSGVYIAYLDVWSRHINALDDPLIREVALGGPDTATREKNMAQVKLLRVGNTGVNFNCLTAAPEWDALIAPSTARLRARTQVGAVSNNPCIIEPGAGYRRLENQLYRVEIHKAGAVGTAATFKWSRDNGSIETSWLTQNVAELTVGNIGHDAVLRFNGNQWVELTDDTRELNGLPGTMVRLVKAEGQVLTLDAATAIPAGPINIADFPLNPKVRRWDLANGVDTVTIPGGASGGFLALEDGIEIRFQAGAVYKTGDYWLIPARTAKGEIEWPGPPNAPLPLPPHGIQHQYARLAVLDFNGAAFAKVIDCRQLFPPLTQLTAKDIDFDNTVCGFAPAAETVQDALDRLCRTQHCSCTILLSPGDDLKAAFAKLAPGQNALICFKAGDYRVRDTVVIANKGHLRLTGCGPGTRLFSSKSECVLRFENCPSVSVEHLSAGGGNTNMRFLNGALTFLDCRSVSVQHSMLACRGFGKRRVTCLTVRNVVRPGVFTSARISGCDFSTGHLQTGILLVNVSRSFVSDNILRAGHRPPSGQLLQDKGYRARIRRNLISNGSFGALKGESRKLTNARVTVSGHTVHFRTDPSLTTRDPIDNQWVLALAGIGSVGSAGELYGLLEAIGDQALLNIGPARLPRSIRNLAQLALREDTAAGGQGIVIGGTQAREVHIAANSIESFVQGVHVGLSHDDNLRGTAHSAGHVVIARNSAIIQLGPAAARERHGIFVGNFTSLDLQGNRLQGVRPKPFEGVSCEGIRVYGVAGPRMIICDNDMDNFTTGIAFVTRGVPSARLWLISGNLAQRAAQGVQAHERIGQQLSSVRNKIRGVTENVP